MIEKRIKWHDICLKLIPIKTEPEMGSTPKYKEHDSNVKHYLKKK